MKKSVQAVLWVLGVGLSAVAQEVKLPDVLTLSDGRKVTTVEAWVSLRRPEILEWFRANLYGRAPIRRPAGMTFQVLESDTNALDGVATRKQVRILFSKEPEAPFMDVLIYLPNKRPRPVPVFAGLNKWGNQTVHTDSNIFITSKWNKPGHPERMARGAMAPSWPVETILARGYGVATAHCSDLVPDDEKDGLKKGVTGFFDPICYPNGRPDDAWGAIAAWAWGLSRMMDYFEADPDIDQTRVAVVGHSRRGKAALWCGAQDERFALTIGNDSGGQGAALARVSGGQDDIRHLVEYAPHWFCENWKRYVGQDERLPMDQHMLLALVAPRPLCVASASADPYAFSVRDFLSCAAASPVWGLYGQQGLTTDRQPPPETPVQGGRIGYHIRTGGHGLLAYDWACYLDAADKWLENTPGDVQKK